MLHSNIGEEGRSASSLMSTYLSPYSPSRSLGDYLHRKDVTPLRTVEIVGRFRRTYNFDPAASASATNVAFEEYRSKTDSKPIYEDQQALSIDTTSPPLRLEYPKRQEIVKIHTLTRKDDGLKPQVDKDKGQLLVADPRQYYVSRIDIPHLSTNQPKIPAGTYGGQVGIPSIPTDRPKIPDWKYEEKQPSKVTTIRISETVERAETVTQERKVIKNRAAIQEARSPPTTRKTKEEPIQVEYKPPLTNMHIDIGDILQWIADREAMIETYKVGHNYDDLQATRKRYDHFMQDTHSIGNDKISLANEGCDRVIATKHPDAPLVALWKDNLNEAWENLMESMRTWAQMLDAYIRLYKFFHDCRQLLADIQDEARIISNESFRDSSDLFEFQRRHANLSSDMGNLESRVQQLRYDSDTLLSSYAGDTAAEIQNRLADVTNAWNDLEPTFGHKRFNLEGTGDLFNFTRMVQDNRHSMDALKRRVYMVGRQNDPMNAATVRRELRAINADLTAHEPSFQSCVSFGRHMILRRHYGSYQVEKTIKEMEDEQQELLRMLEGKWEQLGLVLKLCDHAIIAPSGSSFWSLQHGPAEEMITAITSRAHRNSSMSQDELFQSLMKLPLSDLKELHRKQLSEPRRMRTMPNLKQSPTPQRIETAFLPADGVAKVETTLGGQANGSVPNPELCAGFLLRKHTWSSVTSRAKYRKWEEFYCVLRGRELMFYKDRHLGNGGLVETMTLGPECIVKEAKYYTKRDNVFSIRLEDGAEFLFQAQDKADMDRWLNRLQRISGEGQSRDWQDRSSQTLNRTSVNRTKPYFAYK